MKHRITAFFSDDSGTAAIEYAVVAAGIFLAIVIVVGEVGAEVLTIFENLSDRMAEQQGT